MDRQADGAYPMNASTISRNVINETQYINSLEAVATLNHIYTHLYLCCVYIYVWVYITQ